MVEPKYSYVVDIENIDDEAFHLLDRLGWIHQENYEGNGWMRVDLYQSDANILEWLVEHDLVTVDVCWD